MSPVKAFDHREYVDCTTEPWAEPDFVIRLRHPNIVAYVGVERRVTSIVVRDQPVYGVNCDALASAMRCAGAPWPRILALHVAAELAEGLAYAHQLTVDGIATELIHGYVRPDQVLIDTKGEVVLDGFADQFIHTAVWPHDRRGAESLSPEVRRGLPPDKRTDVFGLGLVLQSLLANESSTAALADQTLIDRALAEDPGGRWPSVRAMLTDLRHVVPIAGRTERSAQLAALVAAFASG